MANRKVAVYKQVKVNGVWVKCPPYFNSKNKKPENDKVLVKGVMEVHPEGDWESSITQTASGSGRLLARSMWREMRPTPKNTSSAVRSKSWPGS
jgi:hypothetical protein